jgi:hypothetical protein
LAGSAGSGGAPGSAAPEVSDPPDLPPPPVPAPSGAASGPAAESSAAETPASAAPSQGPRRIEGPEVEPVDLLATAGAPVGRRLLPVGIGALVALLLFRRWRRRG